MTVINLISLIILNEDILRNVLNLEMLSMVWFLTVFKDSHLAWAKQNFQIGAFKMALLKIDSQSEALNIGFKII